MTAHDLPLNCDIVGGHRPPLQPLCRLRDLLRTIGRGIVRIIGMVPAGVVQVVVAGHSLKIVIIQNDTQHVRFAFFQMLQGAQGKIAGCRHRLGHKNHTLDAGGDDAAVRHVIQRRRIDHNIVEVALQSFHHVAESSGQKQLTRVWGNSSAGHDVKVGNVARMDDRFERLRAREKVRQSRLLFQRENGARARFAHVRINNQNLGTDLR